MDSAEAAAVASLLADDELRLEAAEILFAVRDGRARAVLYEIAADPGEPAATRLRAARLLAEDGDVSARTILLDLVAAGVRLGPSVREQLAGPVDPQARGARLTAEEHLAVAELLGDDPAVSGILERLAADAGVARPARIRALEMLAGSPPGREALARLVRQGPADLWLSLQAARALGSYGIEPLRDLAADPGLGSTGRLGLAQALRALGDPAGTDLLLEVATDQRHAPAVRHRAARFLLGGIDAGPLHLASLVKCDDLTQMLRATAVRRLCLDSAEHPAVRELATDRALEPPYRAWAAWTLTRQDGVPDETLLAVAADEEIDDWVRLAALDRVRAQALREIALDAQRPRPARELALDGLLRRHPQPAARVLSGLAFGTADGELRAAALRAILAAEPEERSRARRTLATDDRVPPEARLDLLRADSDPAPSQLERDPTVERRLDVPHQEEPDEPDFETLARHAESGDQHALEKLAKVPFARLPAGDRIRAASLLAGSRHPAARAAVYALSADPDLDERHRAEIAGLLAEWSDRLAAAVTLLVARPAEGIARLRALATDADEPLPDRVSAAVLLAEAHDEAGVTALVELLPHPDLTGQDRDRVLQALRDHGGASGRAALHTLVTSTSLPPRLRLQAARTLAVH